jgi:hypothetical protein
LNSEDPGREAGININGSALAESGSSPSKHDCLSDTHTHVKDSRLGLYADDDREHQDRDVLTSDFDSATMAHAKNSKDGKHASDIDSARHHVKYSENKCHGGISDGGVKNRSNNNGHQGQGQGRDLGVGLGFAPLDQEEDILDHAESRADANVQSSSSSLSSSSSTSSGAGSVKTASASVSSFSAPPAASSSSFSLSSSSSSSSPSSCPSSPSSSSSSASSPPQHSLTYATPRPLCYSSPNRQASAAAEGGANEGRTIPALHALVVTGQDDVLVDPANSVSSGYACYQYIYI